jgi:hypothetical protein
VCGTAATGVAEAKLWTSSVTAAASAAGPCAIANRLLRLLLLSTAAAAEVKPHAYIIIDNCQSTLLKSSSAGIGVGQWCCCCCCCTAAAPAAAVNLVLLWLLLLLRLRRYTASPT